MFHTTVNYFPFYLLVLVQALAKQGIFQHLVEVGTFNQRYVMFLLLMGCQQNILNGQGLKDNTAAHA